MKEHQSHQEDIRGLLQEQFGGFEDRPDRDVWAAIEAEMADTPAKRKAWLPYLMVAASVALLLCMILLLKGPTSSEVLVEQQAPTPSEQVNPVLTPAITPTESATAEAETHSTPSESSEKASQVYQVASVTPLQQPATQSAKNQSEGQNGDEYEYFAEVTPISEQPTHQIQPLSADQVNANLQGEKPLSGAPIEAGVPIQANPNRVRRMGQRNTLDMNELTLSDAVQFASTELEKLAASPIKVHQEQKGNGEVKTYQFSFLDLRITTKSHRKRTR